MNEQKMMALSGRDPQGKARPLTSDEAGNLRQLLISVLSYDQDSVALGGALAESLKRQNIRISSLSTPSGQRQTLASQGVYTILDTEDHVVLEELSVWADNNNAQILITPKNGNVWGTMTKTGGSSALWYAVFSDDYTKSGIWSRVYKDPESLAQIVSLNRPLEFPEGVNVSVKNGAAVSMQASFNGIYSVVAT